MSSRDWFERLMGFSEDGYASTCSRLVVEGDELVSTVNGRRYGIGALSLPTLAQLRARVNRGGRQRSTVTCLPGDARALHADPAFAGALFQVASQFNLLEMVSPHVTPEQGVAGYAHDATQGPACAMAAGAATIYPQLSCADRRADRPDPRSSTRCTGPAGGRVVRGAAPSGERAVADAQRICAVHR
jgi:hypothetical protein